MLIIHHLVGDLALESSLKQQFPNLSHVLCIWHIKKDINSHAVGAFSDSHSRESFLKSFMALTKIRNEDKFQEEWNKLLNQISSEKFKSHMTSTVYARKEKWGGPWVGKLMHLGLTSNSMSESTFSALKRGGLGPKMTLEDGIKHIFTYAEEKVTSFPERKTSKTLNEKSRLTYLGVKTNYLKDPCSMFSH